MTLRTLLSVYGALSVIGGALWMAVPGRLLDLFGVSGGGQLVALLAALFGAAVFGLGAMALFARGADPSRGRTALVLGLTLINLLWFVVILLIALSGDVNGLGWIPVVAYAMWTVLFVIAGRSDMKQPVTAIAG